jgi:hypothetical protein
MMMTKRALLHLGKGSSIVFVGSTDGQTFIIDGGWTAR